MPAYTGKFQYLDESGAPVSAGACQFRFDAETATVTPSHSTWAMWIAPYRAIGNFNFRSSPAGAWSCASSARRSAP